MANFQIQAGDDWSVAIPVYKVRNNYDMWLAAGNTGVMPAYLAAYDAWRLANKDGTEEAFMNSLYPDGVPVRKIALDLSGYTLSYQLRVDESPVPDVQPIITTLLPDENGGTYDAASLGRFALSLTSQKTGTLQAGSTYTGQLQLVKGGITTSADVDTITIVQDYNHA